MHWFIIIIHRLVFHGLIALPTRTSRPPPALMRLRTHLQSKVDYSSFHLWLIESTCIFLAVYHCTSSLYVCILYPKLLACFLLAFASWALHIHLVLVIGILLGPRLMIMLLKLLIAAILLIPFTLKVICCP